MGKKIYVGNLPYTVDDEQLHEAFANYGQVVSARVIMDRDSGRSKGFGFVEMGSDQDASSAVKSLDGTELGGRNINVSEARESTGGGGGSRGGGGGFRGGGGGGFRGGDRD